MTCTPEAASARNVSSIGARGVGGGAGEAGKVGSRVSGMGGLHGGRLAADILPPAGLPVDPPCGWIDGGERHEGEAGGGRASKTYWASSSSWGTLAARSGTSS